MVNLFGLWLLFLLGLLIRLLMIAGPTNKAFSQMCHFANNHWMTGTDQRITEEEVDKLVNAYCDWDIIQLSVFHWDIWSVRDAIKTHLAKHGLDLETYERKLYGEVAHV